MNPYLSAHQAARALGTSPAVVSRMVEGGELKATRDRIEAASVERVLAARRATQAKLNARAEVELARVRREIAADQARAQQQARNDAWVVDECASTAGNVFRVG